MTNEKTERIKYDRATSKWFKEHPFHQTTIMQCDRCGLYFKPILGHKCKLDRVKTKE